MKKYAYAWITLAFFTISIVLHWTFGWFAYLNQSQDTGQVAQLAPYVLEMGRDTFENWQSEFLQLLWQVVGLAYFLYVGSPASKEGGDRLEAKIDALLQLVGKDRGEALIKAIDETHLRPHGHASTRSGSPDAS